MAGRTIVLTRPVGDARTLVRAVRRLGGRPVVLPGSSLRAVAEPPAGLRVPADVRIYLSPAAVRFASRFDAGRPATRTRIVLAPGAAILLITLAFNFLGDGLRDAMDPYLKT